MNQEQILEVLQKIKKVRIAVYGDFCLDAYWIMDPRGSEVSIETGLKAEAVSQHYYSPGGASNIVTNLATLEPSQIKVIGVIGDDIFGRELSSQLIGLGVDTSSLIVQKTYFNTYTFTKKYLEGKEEPRIDFGFFNKRTVETDEYLIENIESALKNYDLLIFNQQVPGSITNEFFIERVNELFQRYDKIVLFDSRHYSDRFNHVYRKTNEIELARLKGRDVSTEEIISSSELKAFAENIYKETQKPLFITRGARGILVIDTTGVTEIPGLQLLKELDPVGAGDTVISAIALCLAAGLKPTEAATFANFAAAVTVQKLFTTGTASGQEILEISKDPDYIYQPELAMDLRRANYFHGTDIEICYTNSMSLLGDIKYAVFDHDGTISTLRQGWETIMEPVMLKAILGKKYDTGDETLYQKVRKRVKDYINKSTGLQTILQMEALVEMIREFNIIPANKILDKFGYKAIYNEALMKIVNQRLEKYELGQYTIEDVTIKGAVEFLKHLREKDVKLFLASGTDKEDVQKEAEKLGYAELFNGGIFGAVGISEGIQKRK